MYQILQVHHEIVRVTLIANVIILVVSWLMPVPIDLYLQRFLLLSGLVTVVLSTQCPVRTSFEQRRIAQLRKYAFLFFVIAVLQRVLLGPAQAW